MVNSVDWKVNAEKLPCVGLRLNASKPESMLERGDVFISFPKMLSWVRIGSHLLWVQDHKIVTALVSQEVKLEAGEAEE